MQQIDIQQLKTEGLTDYTDSHLAFIKDAAPLTALLGNTGIRTGFVLCVVCQQGRLQVEVDHAVLTIVEHEAMVCPLNSVVGNCLTSADFKAFAVCLCPSIFKDLYLNRQMWEYYQFVLRHHVVPIPPVDWDRLMKYHDLLLESFGNIDRKFGQQVIDSLWQVFIYEFLNVVDRRVSHVRPQVEQSINGEVLSSRFMELLAASEGRMHSVADFAAQLFVTPKYLSMSVKQTTGKPALKWIHENLSKRIDWQLRHSDKSIKEIADSLNFPNPSFFGKFVKAHLGDTPANIRNQGNNRKEL